MSRMVRKASVLLVAGGLGCTLATTAVLTGTMGAAGASSFAAKKAIPLTAAITRPAGHPVANQTVTISFRGTRAASTGGTITQYLFDAGDHTKVTKGTKVPATLKHKYTKAGKYTMTLTVVDSKKHKATKRVGLQILAPKLAGGSGSTGTVVTPPTPTPACAAITHPAAGAGITGSQATGTITDAAGNPLPGIPVYLEAAGGINVPFSTLFAGITIPILNIPLSSILNIPGNLVIPVIQNTVTTNAQGQFGLDALPVDWVPPIDLGPLAGLPLPIIGQIQGDLRTEILKLLIGPQLEANIGPNADLHYSQVTPQRGIKDIDGLPIAGGLQLPLVRHFQLVPAGTVTGRLVDGAGNPVAGETVEALTPPSISPTYIYSTDAQASAADGTFTLPQIPLGHFKVVGMHGAASAAPFVDLTSCQPDASVGNIPG